MSEKFEVRQVDEFEVRAQALAFAVDAATGRDVSMFKILAEAEMFRRFLVGALNINVEVSDDAEQDGAEQGDAEQDGAEACECGDPHCEGPEALAALLKLMAEALSGKA